MLNGSGSWEGNLTKLEPYKSYMVRVGKFTTASYKKTPRPENWQINPSAFKFNMVVTGRLKFNEQSSIDTNDIVGAFVNGELRGVAKLSYLPQIKKYRVVVFVYSNKASGETVKFKLFDNDSETLYNAFDDVEFVQDGLVGNLSNPHIFSNLKSSGVHVPSLELLQINAQPNPFNGTTTINYQDKKDSEYELLIYNAVGALVHSKHIHSVRGPNSVAVDFEALGLGKGMYHLQLKGQSQSGIVKVVKQ